MVGCKVCNGTGDNGCSGVVCENCAGTVTSDGVECSVYCTG